MKKALVVVTPMTKMKKNKNKINNIIKLIKYKKLILNKKCQP